MEREYRGKSVYRGLTIGPIAVLKKNDVQVKREKIEDAKQEIERVKQAVADSQAQLQHLYDKAVKEVGEASAAIFESASDDVGRRRLSGCNSEYDSDRTGKCRVCGCSDR